MKTTTTIMWFRQDLRLADNAAFVHACTNGPVVPIYLFDETDRPLGGASRWWVERSLFSLKQKLPHLIVRRGDPLEQLKALAIRVSAKSIVWNRVYEPHAVSRDTEIKKWFLEQGLDVRSFAGSYLKEPWCLKTGSGGPYKVFTPFWRSLSSLPIDPPLACPNNIDGSPEELESLTPLFDPSWASRWQENWTPGENGAALALQKFLETGLISYGEMRNRPDRQNVSRLSPHLHFGEISPRQIWARTKFLINQKPVLEGDANKFLSEIVWREFSTHLLYHFPKLVVENWKPVFDNYPWRDNREDLQAWQKGQTGYPLVDAGMRELWKTGYMHNRVRMVAASFLIKHLQIHWKHGETWFWDTLLDADLANNCASWQWVAGSGADAAPYFRIFNPIAQGEKFDPKGVYVRKWCPELSALPDKYLNRPFEAPAKVLEIAGVELGNTYPLPIVEHKAARQRALQGYKQIKIQTAQ